MHPTHVLRASRELRLLVVLVSLTGALGAVAQEPVRPQYRTSVELVQFQVAVRSESGDFVAGLQPSDFELKVNGQFRPVTLAYEVDLTREALASDSGVAATDELPGQGIRPIAARRYFLFLFDFRYTTRRGLREARRAASAFLEGHLRRSDVVAIATINRFGANFPIPFTDDWRAVKARIEEISLKAATDANEGQTVTPSNFAEVEAEVARYLKVLGWLAETLRAVQGRKHLVLFSAGFPDETIAGAGLEHRSRQAEARASGSPFGYIELGDPAYASGSPDVRRAVDRAIDLLRGSDVVVHSVDARGLRFDAGNGRQSLVAIASGTGGEAYWNMNDVEVALHQIDDATSRFYVLAYKRDDDDPGQVKLSIRLRVPKAALVYAPTLLRLPPSEEDMTAQQRWVKRFIGQR